MVPSVLEFGRRQLHPEDISGNLVVEVGAQNVNGSLRPIIEGYGPKRYVGVDIEAGPGVDEVCNAEVLVGHFGLEQVDLLVSTELIEHVRNWRIVLSNFKQVLRPGGVLLITTRSAGFHFHGYPFDFWRYELSDMERIFCDFEIEALETDPGPPGVFIKARKPLQGFTETDGSSVCLYSMIRERRCRDVTELDILRWKVRDYFRTQMKLVRKWIGKI